MYARLKSLFFIVACLSMLPVYGQDGLKEMQQKFVNDKFGMFIHFNMPTFVDEDWPGTGNTGGNLLSQKTELQPMGGCGY